MNEEMKQIVCTHAHHHDINFFILWLLGAVLSFPRLVASTYAIDEDYICKIKPSKLWLEFFISIGFSWLGFVAGIIVYLVMEHKYFWKWSKKDLWIIYNLKNPKPL